MTRAMNDLHRAARPTRLPTGASTQLQLPSGRNPGSPSRCQPRPPTLPPSLSHLKQSRECPIAEERRWGYFVGAENAQNAGDQWLAAHDQPSPTAMPASPFASRCSRLASRLKLARPHHDAPSYRGTSAASHNGSPAARRRGPNDDQDDGFTSAGTTSTARFKRLDSDFIFSTPREAASSRPIAE